MARPKLVNVREFRANLTRYLEESREEDAVLILMRHSEPMARLVPFEQGTKLEDIVRDAPAPKKSAVKKSPKSQKKPGTLRRMFGW